MKFDDDFLSLSESDLGLGKVATKSLDFNEAADALGVVSIDRLFPDAGEFEPRTRAEGLHKWYVVHYNESVAVTKAETSLKDIPGVETVDVVPRLKLESFNDPLLSKQWNYRNDGSLGGSYKAGIDINVQTIWDKYTTGSPKVIVGVVDSGADPEHPDLKGVCIGADAGTSAGEAAWNGDVVIARVYNDPLSAEQVSALYSAVKKDQSVSTLDISDISFLSPCELKAGYKFYVYASGLKSGDVLRLESLSSESSAFDCVTDSGNGFLRLTVPSAIASGNYRIMLERGSYGYPLGTVKVAVSDHPVNVGSTRVVAHRGYHVDGGASENSIAALAGAQKIGAYACEFDTWITTDGVVVINHNANVGSDARKIQYSTYSELKDLTLSNGEKLPTLKSYLEQGKKGDVKLMLEIKTHASREDNNRVVDSCLAAVSRAGLDDKMIYIAFDYENCKRIVSKRPAAIVQYLGGNKTPAEVAADGLKGIGYSYSVLSSRPEWITGARQLGILVDVWTVNNSQMMLDYISKGVDLITTDYPTTLQDLLGRTYVTAPD